MIIGVLNQKGGVGKTTIAIHIAAALAQEGPNLAKAKMLAKYHTVNQVDRLHGGTTPAHAGRESEERERFAVT